MRLEGSNEDVPELADSYRLDCVNFESSDVPISGELQQNLDGQVVFTSLRWDAYNRVHLCTNTEQLLQITSKNPQVE